MIKFRGLPLMGEEQFIVPADVMNHVVEGSQGSYFFARGNNNLRDFVRARYEDDSEVTEVAGRTLDGHYKIYPLSPNDSLTGLVAKVNFYLSIPTIENKKLIKNCEKLLTNIREAISKLEVLPK